MSGKKSEDWKGRLIVGKPGEEEIESVKRKRGKRGDRRQRERERRCVSTGRQRQERTRKGDV